NGIPGRLTTVLSVRPGQPPAVTVADRVEEIAPANGRRADDPAVGPIDALAELGEVVRDRRVVPAGRPLPFVPPVGMRPVGEGATRLRVVARHLERGQIRSASGVPSPLCDLRP